MQKFQAEITNNFFVYCFFQQTMIVLRRQMLRLLRTRNLIVCTVFVILLYMMRTRQEFDPSNLQYALGQVLGKPDYFVPRSTKVRLCDYYYFLLIKTNQANSAKLQVPKQKVYTLLVYTLIKINPNSLVLRYSFSILTVFRVKIFGFMITLTLIKLIITDSKWNL